MNVFEEAENAIWNYLDNRGEATEYISISGTLDSLMNDGWTPTEIATGKADAFIPEHAIWLD